MAPKQSQISQLVKKITQSIRGTRVISDFIKKQLKQGKTNELKSTILICGSRVLSDFTTQKQLKQGKTNGFDNK